MENIMQILVIGSPRSGSHWPVDYLQKAWGCDYVGKLGSRTAKIDYANLPSNVIVHSHDFEDLPDNYGDWHLVLTYRKDTFDQMVSILYCQITGEWTFYADKRKRDPIDISLGKCLDAHAKWNVYNDPAERIAKLLSHAWKSKTMVAYEDLCESVSCLDHLKPTSPPENSVILNVSQSSGHDYRKLISNYDTLRETMYDIQSDYFKYFNDIENGQLNRTAKENFDFYIANTSNANVLEAYKKYPRAMENMFQAGQAIVFKRQTENKSQVYANYKFDKERWSPKS